MPTTAPAFPAALPPHVVLFDGECGVCSHAVRWLLDADHAGRLHFAPLQGATAAAVRARHPGLPAGPDSIIHVERDGDAERVRVRAAAVLRLLDVVDAPRLGWLRALRWLPGPIADLGYRIFASNRHRLGRSVPACRLPTAAEQARFLP